MVESEDRGSAVDDMSVEVDSEVTPDLDMGPDILDMESDSIDMDPDPLDMEIDALDSSVQEPDIDWAALDEEISALLPAEALWSTMALAYSSLMKIYRVLALTGIHTYIATRLSHGVEHKKTVILELIMRMGLQSFRQLLITAVHF